MEDHPRLNADGETKAETFKRLANRRTQTALDKIALIGNLGSSQYESSHEEREKIIFALTDAVTDAGNRLFGTKGGKEPFSL